MIEDNFNILKRKLSVRATNVLRETELDLFQNFYQRIMINKEEIDFQSLRNCGVRTKIEIVNFFDNVINSDKNKIFISNKYGQTNSYPNLNIESDDLEITLNNEIIFNVILIHYSNNLKKFLNLVASDNLVEFIANFIGVNRELYWKRANDYGLTIELQKFISDISKICFEYKERDIGLFALLNIEVDHFNTFTQIEDDIFKYRLNYINTEKSETLQSLASKYGLTRERIRQIEVRLHKKITLLINKYSADFENVYSKYFYSEYFIIDEKFAKSVNEKEGTSFSLSFITKALIEINPVEHRYYEIYNNKLATYGIFINKRYNFDFSKSFKEIFDLLKSKRKNDIEISFDDLLKKYKKNNEEEYNYKFLLIDIIKLFKAIVDSKQMQINSNNIVLKRNTKILAYEYLREILNHKKAPMHFNDIFDECKKRGINIKSALSVHGQLQLYPDIFGLKGPGTYGLKEWGGYFGTIGDVAEQYLKERGQPIGGSELKEFLSRELFISYDSIYTILFTYYNENRFVRLKSGKIGLKEWHPSNRSEIS